MLLALAALCVIPSPLYSASVAALSIDAAGDATLARRSCRPPHAYAPTQLIYCQRRTSGSCRPPTWTPRMEAWVHSPLSCPLPSSSAFPPAYFVFHVLLAFEVEVSIRDALISEIIQSSPFVLLEKASPLSSAIISSPSSSLRQLYPSLCLLLCNRSYLRGQKLKFFPSSTTPLQHYLQQLAGPSSVALSSPIKVQDASWSTNRTRRSRGSGSPWKVSALPEWPLMAVMVEHVPFSRDWVIHKSVWHLSDEAIKTQEDIEEQARAEMWREELIEEIEQKVGGLRELEDAGKEEEQLSCIEKSKDDWQPAVEEAGRHAAGGL
ncbi:hypothetical protein AXF42_Ash011766 [Apostasia shenzhenica]|uniref:Uncharacterized protein n=1 Tax=Apostasia shenzhenica TaxID=1088818 RepID=A0A2H9ZUW8_9ASPA|nr:hypothetical protein AXF42_Ash011766 [Apostasia shenzhenica]